MAYQPLARKYRPSRFEDLVGQEFTVKVLRNALILGREPQGLIFSGTRGVGKTTLARIYGKALNCELPAKDQRPCGSCSNCELIARGIHEDIIEIDGASNTGVDDIRNLLETLSYIPARGKYKVYIIDEVHMLSISAFNALLKSLEEPPAHVVFIFATTELDRIPATIQSRCQVFHLKKIKREALAQRLTAICEREGVPCEARAIAQIARQAEGSMRDGLSLLDQAIALGGGEVSESGLALLAPLARKSFYLKLLHALLKRDGAQICSLVEELDDGGVDYEEATASLLTLVHDAYLLQKLAKRQNPLSALDLSEADLDVLTKLAASAAPNDWNLLFKTLVTCHEHLRGGNLDRLVFENHLLEWCFDPGFPFIDDLLSSGSGGSRPFAPQAGSSAKTGNPAPASTTTVNTMNVNTTTGNTSVTVKAPSPARPGRGLSAAFDEATAPEAKSSASPAAPNQTPTQTPAPPTPANAASAAPVPTVPAAAAIETQADLPETWASLLQAWKREKPLLARKLEELVPLAYGKERIILGFAEDSLLADSPAERQGVSGLKVFLEERFAFRGELALKKLPKTEESTRSTQSSSAKEPASAPAPAPAALSQAPESARPKSVLEEKTEARTKQRQATEQAMKTHPVTKAFEQQFNVKADRLSIADASLADI